MSSLDTFKIQRTNINTGVDAKLLLYEINLENMCETQIDLKNILENSIVQSNGSANNIGTSTNSILINIERDVDRYKSSMNELNKISFNNFMHLKATYWKEKDKFVNDLNYVIDFLQKFNGHNDTNITTMNKITINEFSECNDPNIYIQDGPLACYCSHLRAMIYGYQNFVDYTIIMEDDLMIGNTENIEKYVKCIPKDWDIICFGAAPKNVTYNDAPFYKFTNEYHSTHFYIINHKCHNTLFKNLYPVVDQVDVLMSNLVNELNIYNIPNTVFQKNVSTNTQNNLHVIFTSPNYDILRLHIDYIKNNLNVFVKNELSDSDNDNVDNIVSLLMCDVLYFNIRNCNATFVNDMVDNEDEVDNEEEILQTSELLKIYESLLIIIGCSTKGSNVNKVTKSLLNNMINIIRKFKLHNTLDNTFGVVAKAYSYGSSSNTYLLKNNNVIIKEYYKVLRWKTKNHENVNDVFNNEVKILEKVNNGLLLKCDYDKKLIYLTYQGKSLYDNFVLPEDWKKQIVDIFTNLTKNKIYYPEFNIKNILVLNNKISFVDYGLAQIYDLDTNSGTNSGTNLDTDINTTNCANFIELLEILNIRFKTVNTVGDKNIFYTLYDTFINNIKLHKVEKYLANVF